ncbi:hypothetical protein LJC56_08335 [Christensenellaceae bacterium OttesenSCG-928-K19]|nr:hypothetical protein [Christensenellaceae bacterium OttesenSCG-928-K19]
MKKTVTVLLAILLCIAVFSGCGGAPEADTETGDALETTWSGLYKNENGYAVIEGFSDEMLIYTFEMNDGTYFNGAAEVSGDFAQTDALRFVMDGSVLTVSVDEAEAGNPDFEVFAGEYIWTNEEMSTPVADDSMTGEVDGGWETSDDSALDGETYEGATESSFAGYWYEADLQDSSYCIAIYAGGTFEILSVNGVKESGTYTQSVESDEWSDRDALTLIAGDGTELYATYFIDTLDMENENGDVVSFLPGPEPMAGDSYVENTGDASVLVGNWYPNGDEEEGIISFYDDYTYEWATGMGYKSYNYIFDGIYLMINAGDEILRCEMTDENTILFEQEGIVYQRADA